MARRKKRKKTPNEAQSPKKGSAIFNPLMGLISVPVEQDAKEDRPDTSGQEHPGPESEPAGDQAFLEAVSGVIPLAESKKSVLRPPNPGIRPPHRAGDEDLEVMVHLSDLVSGNAEIDITFTDEYIEGSIAGFSERLMKQLRKGMFPVQDHVDLHGLTRLKAEERVHEFLLQSWRLGLRCVLIVHGKGLNSENHIPVLKERLPVWLNRAPVKKIVLAFSTARPYDGGTGAIYVLLKKFKAGGAN